MNTDMKNVYISPQMEMNELNLMDGISLVVGSTKNVPVHSSAGDMDAAAALARERMMEEEDGFDVEDLW